MEKSEARKELPEAFRSLVEDMNVFKGNINLANIMIDQKASGENQVTSTE